MPMKKSRTKSVDTKDIVSKTNVNEPDCDDFGEDLPIIPWGDFHDDKAGTKEIDRMLVDMGRQRHSKTLFRDEIIHEISSILISENKPNALLIGPAGCGKTNIVEELARRIRRKDKYIPRKLWGYKVFSLGLSDVMSGCGLVGELERKVNSLVDRLEDENNKAILFLDEVHMLFSGESYKKVAQILKPALSRGKFMVIAATTTQEVKKIDEDPAFNRRFTRVLVDELNVEQTREVLNKVVKSMEKHYGMKIRFSKAISELIVRTADEFCMVGSHRPDNAITLMDRAVGAKIIEMQATETEDGVVVLDEDFIERTAFKLTSGNSSVKEFNEKSFRKALSKVRGQDDIVEDLTRVIKLYDMHVRPRNKPLTFLFAGPSGVGKSEVAKILAKEYMDEKPIILNMAEYHSSASINRIIGAPSGYVGADSNMELPFDALDTNPYQVILLDEFEKCDRSVQRLFMSAFDEGIMKTNLGKEIDFSKTIIIATTNAGCTGKVSSIGFGEDTSGSSLTVSDLADYFDIELINRFSYKYTFHGISRDTYRSIVRDCLVGEIENLRLGRFEAGTAGFFKDAASAKDIDMLVEKSYDPRLGARPAKTVTTEYVDGLLLTLMERTCCERKERYYA